MSLLIQIIPSLVISYLIGAIPSAYIFGRLYKGIDIRQHGSGNVGATNTFRILGKVPGTIVLLLDICKGVIAVVFVSQLFGLDHVMAYVFLGMAAVVGHNWTIFLQFKGGKGIATSLGVLIGLAIKIAAIRSVLMLTLFVWIAVFVLSGYISLASMVAGCALPILMVITNQVFELIVLGIILCLFIILRHRPNIQRLLKGNESRVALPFFPKK